MTIACVDVAYGERGARAACVLIDAWKSQLALACYVEAIDTRPHAYEPGFFYRRELPYLLAVLRLLPALPALVIIDGYVWLPPDGRPGLGAHVYEALARRITVVGIAKRPFDGVEACDCVWPILRGASRQPLFVTAAGMTNAAAAVAVRAMAGKHRIPDMVRMADRLAREGTIAPPRACARTMRRK
jgi:deoxyribonuclease V